MTAEDRVWEVRGENKIPDPTLKRRRWLSPRTRSPDSYTGGRKGKGTSFLSPSMVKKSGWGRR